MATGSLDANGIWIYGEDDSEATFSALLNKLGDSTSDQIGTLKQSGRVVQTVSASNTTEVSTTAGVWVTTQLTATITPKSASNKILAIVSMPVYTNTAAGFYTIFRGTVSGTNLGNTNGFLLTLPGVASSFSANYLDSPATTSATTYTVGMKSAGGSTGTISTWNTTKSTITLLEIAG